MSLPTNGYSDCSQREVEICSEMTGYLYLSKKHLPDFSVFLCLLVPYFHEVLHLIYIDLLFPSSFQVKFGVIAFLFSMPESEEVPTEQSIDLCNT